MVSTVSTMALQLKNMSNEDFANLTRQAKADPAAFGRLYDLFVQPIFKYLYRRVGSRQDAEDLTSQTFISAFESITDYREQGHFAAWLFQIARYKLVDYYRRTGQVQTLEVTEKHVSTEDKTLHRIVKDEDLHHLQSLIGGLDDKAQDLIYLRYVAGLSYAEMGEILHKRSNTVKKSIYRLLARLKSQME